MASLGFFWNAGGIPAFHEVSCLSWFHSNRDRYRYRYRYRNRLFNHELTGWHRSVFLERRGEFPLFMKFHVFHGFI